MEFKEYCSKHGIKHKKTVPGTPQHNGVVERMNRTIVEKVRRMLKLPKLPKSFWGEVVNTAVRAGNEPSYSSSARKKLGSKKARLELSS